MYDNSKALIVSINDSIGKEYGFKVALCGNAIQCLNASLTKSQQEKKERRHANVPGHQRRQRKNNRCGCLLKINYTFANPRDKGDKRVVITKGAYCHTNGCRPSSQELLQHNVRSGTYSRDHGLKQQSLTTLLNMIKYQEHVDARAIRNVLRDVLPDGVPIDAPLIANVRARAMRILDNMEKDKHGNIIHEPTISAEDAATLLHESTEDAANNKMCGKDPNDPDVSGLAIKELKSLLQLHDCTPCANR